MRNVSARRGKPRRDQKKGESTNEIAMIEAATPVSIVWIASSGEQHAQERPETWRRRS
jgi:hypothetical protein